MTTRYLSLALPLAAALALSGCTDDNYDLANIDTSTEIPVNDLVIPVNLGTVTLNNVIKLDDSKTITKEPYIGSDPALQGKDVYVYNYNGDFTSEKIHINEFFVKAPGNINPSIVHVNLLDNVQVKKKAPVALGTFEYNVNQMSTDFHYNINDVDPKVVSVNEITTPKVTFAIKLDIPTNVMAMSSEVELQNVRINFPKGMTMKSGKPATSSIGTYNPESGDVLISSYKTSSGKVELALTAEVLDLKKLGLILNNGQINFDGKISVESGKFVLSPKIDSFKFPSEFDIDISYNLSNFQIENFTGNIDYNIEGLQFDDAMLTDIPDFLSQSDTRIRIANPQIYLSINNSCAEYGLGGLTGLSVTPYRKGQAGTTISMEDDIIVGHNKGVGPYQFAISPEGKQLKPIESYASAEKLTFSKLGDILYGDGIPQKIRVEFPSPQILGDANQFPLGTDIPAVKGSYVFRAPLALADGSQIVYSGTEDDWHSDTLDDLYVNSLEVTANVTSTVPLEVRLSASILNEDGTHMGVCEATPLPALADNHPIKITITPDKGLEYITGIDGIFYEAWAISTTTAQNPADVPPLSPEQTIQLKDIRVKVNGKYVKIDDGK